MADALYEGLTYVDVGHKFFYDSDDDTIACEKTEKPGIVRPTEAMLKQLLDNSVNPELEPTWKVILLKNLNGIQTSPMECPCETFSQACDNVMKSTFLLKKSGIDTFVQMDHKLAAKENKLLKMKLFEKFADRSGIKLLRYSVSMNSAIGVSLTFE
jgi:hypothetical protein